MVTDYENPAKTTDQYNRCKSMWCSVILSSLDGWISYPSDSDRINQTAVYFKLLHPNDPDYKKNYLREIKEIAKQDGINDARVWLNSDDCTEVLTYAGISTTQKTRDKLLDFVKAGVTSNFSLSKKVHKNSVDKEL